MAVHIVFNELGAPFQLVNVTVPQGQPRTKEYLSINPRGNVPTVVKDGLVIREGAAVLTWLLETNDSPLLPKTGVKRYKILEWLAFANSTLHPAYGKIFFMYKNLGREEATLSPLYEAAINAIQRLWDDVELQLQSSEYIASDECSVADILIAVIANWTPGLKKSVTFGPKTKQLFQRVSARPSFKKALESEQISYTVAD
jgi:glutathione S-transferase